MPERLAFCLKQRDRALKQAEDSPSDGAPWLRLADEWQKLHDALARELGELPPETPGSYVLDS